jgi:hypothetical protein
MFFDLFFGNGRSPLPRLVLGTLKSHTMQKVDYTTLSDHSEFITSERDTGNGYYLVTRRYDHAGSSIPRKADMEVTAIKLGSDDSLRKGGGAVRKNTERSQMDSNTARKSSSRARIAVRRKLLSFSADRMLTLTFKENVTDIDEAWCVFKAFAKKMRKKYPDAFQYVAVPEYQKRGAVHFHVAIKGFYYVNTIRAIWRRCCAHRGGNIDITSPRGFGKNSWNPKRIANYLSKYITKGDTVSFNRKRYGASRNIEIPEAVTGWLPLGICPLYVIEKLIQRMTRNVIDKHATFEFDGYYPIKIMST